MGKLNKEQYIVEIFNKHVEKISSTLGAKGQNGVFSRSKNRWNFSCPFCREGNSWGRQSRFWYDVSKNYVHCYNGGCRVNGLPEHYASTLENVKEVDIIKNYMAMSDVKEEFINQKYQTKKIMGRVDLPEHVINIADIKHYIPKNDIEFDMIERTKEFLIRRRIIEAPYFPSDLHVIVKPKVAFFGRLIIPYNVNGSMVYWQGRALKDSIKPKYLSSKNTCQNVNPLFGIDNIPKNPEYVFLTEAPIDSMFSINTIAIGHDYPSIGTVEYIIDKFNLNRFILPRRHIVLIVDNPMKDSTGLENYIRAVDSGLSVFTWFNDENLKDYKDFNEYVIGTGDILKFTDMKYMKSMTQIGLAAKLSLNTNIKPLYPLSVRS